MRKKSLSIGIVINAACHKPTLVIIWMVNRRMKLVQPPSQSLNLLTFLTYKKQPQWNEVSVITGAKWSIWKLSEWTTKERLWGDLPRFREMRVKKCRCKIQFFWRKQIFLSLCKNKVSLYTFTHYLLSTSLTVH